MAARSRTCAGCERIARGATFYEVERYMTVGAHTFFLHATLDLRRAYVLCEGMSNERSEGNEVSIARAQGARLQDAAERQHALRAFVVAATALQRETGLRSIDVLRIVTHVGELAERIAQLVSVCRIGDGQSASVAWQAPEVRA